MASGVFVSYLRVSTARQGQSGLGLGAQREAIAQFLNGGSWRLAAEVVEIESGKRNDRPRLAEALRLCRLHGATLLIAKLDRLARNVAFVSSLMESGVEFTACDFPTANRLTVHILAAVAEYEAKAISDRTTAALAQKKAWYAKLTDEQKAAMEVDGRKLKQLKLGGFRKNGKKPTDEHRRLGLEAIRRRVAARIADIKPVIEEIRSSGTASLHGIARELTARHIPTARGATMWTAMQVKRALEAAA